MLFHPNTFHLSLRQFLKSIDRSSITIIIGKSLLHITTHANITECKITDGHYESLMVSLKTMFNNNYQKFSILKQYWRYNILNHFGNFTYLYYIHFYIYINVLVQQYFHFACIISLGSANDITLRIFGHSFVLSLSYVLYMISNFFLLLFKKENYEFNTFLSDR